MKNIPNILSVIRLLTVPFIVYLFLTDHFYIAVGVFIFAGVTDVVDGYIARRFGCTSTLGRILDPLADKSVQLSALICLYVKGVVPLFIVLIYFIKELCTIVGALFIMKKDKRVVKSNVFGKIATVSVFVSLSAIVLFDLKGIAATIICAVVALYFFVAGGIYFKDDLLATLKKMRGEKTDK